MAKARVYRSVTREVAAVLYVDKDKATRRGYNQTLIMIDGISDVSHGISQRYPMDKGTVLGKVTKRRLFLLAHQGDDPGSPSSS
jgi:hypothetical protein